MIYNEQSPYKETLKRNIIFIVLMGGFFIGVVLLCFRYIGYLVYTDLKLEKSIKISRKQ